MGKTTNIGWCDSTHNPWFGCTNVSPGCEHCYAETWANTYKLVQWGNAPRRRASLALQREPLKWNREAAEFYALHRRRRRVFCASLADVFDNQVPPEWRTDLWDLIRQCTELDWLILTKRPQNILKMLPTDWGAGWGHVWLGITAEDEVHYRQRWPILARILAAVRFVSHEPALDSFGPLDIGVGAIPDWLITGGESGPQRRPFDPEWAREDRDQCLEHGIPYFFKQWGGVQSLSNGCELDGRHHKAHPLPSHQASVP